MPIEFRCPHCQRLLRVPDGSQGKQAQCPQCQAMVQVPAASVPPTPPMPPAGPQAGPANPFAANFPAAAAAPSDNPYQAPSAAMAPPQPAGAGVYPLVPTKMDLGDVLNRTWEIFKSQLGMLILVIFAVGAINWGVGMISNVVVQAIAASGAEQAVVFTVQGILQIAASVFQIWLGLGQLRFMLKIGRGQAAEFTDIFTGGPYLLPAIGASILLGLLILGMMIPFAAPPIITYAVSQDPNATAIVGIVTGVIFVPLFLFVVISISQFQALIVDRNMGAMESLRTSWEITAGNRLMLFVLGLVLFVVNLLGCLACIVGLFFSASYSALATAVAYLVMTGQPTADQLMRGAPPPQMPPGPMPTV
jgi:uncharacterized membrane protein